MRRNRLVTSKTDLLPDFLRDDLELLQNGRQLHLKRTPASLRSPVVVIEGLLIKSGIPASCGSGDESSSVQEVVVFLQDVVQ